MPHSHVFHPFWGLILLLSKSVGKSVDPSRKENDSPLCNKTHVCHVPAKKKDFFFSTGGCPWLLLLQSSAPSRELKPGTRVPAGPRNRWWDSQSLASELFLLLQRGYNQASISIFQEQGAWHVFHHPPWAQGRHKWVQKRNLDQSQLETTAPVVHRCDDLHLCTQKGPNPMGDLPFAGSKAQIYHQ